MILEATATTASVLALAYKMDLKKVLRYDIAIDFAVTGGLMLVYAGTYSGMVTAMVSGLFLSVTLIFLKKKLGYKKLVRQNGKFVWKEVKWT